jgi:hypothetical protein
MKYKNAEVPDSGQAGVKQIDRGKNKGKYQAFFVSKKGDIYTGSPRENKAKALFDLSILKARIYV